MEVGKPLSGNGSNATNETKVKPERLNCTAKIKFTLQRKGQEKNTLSK
jgi:hypothetical protein